MPILLLAIPVLSTLAGGLLAIRFRRSLALLLANCSLVLLLLLALTSTSAVLPGLYLAGSRILLPLPLAVWLLCFAAFDTAKRTRTQGSGVRGPGVQGAAVHARPRTNQHVIAAIVGPRNGPANPINPCAV